MTGREIGGRYVLLRPLAHGGMAEVWLAEDVVLGRDVAVKMLLPHFLADAGIVERFRAEAHAVAQLNHRNIVAVFDTVVEDDVEAIVMELVDGVTLRQFLDRYGRMNVDDVVHLAAQVADALEAAHDTGIVHRDIKPANILLTQDRTVKVTDFGIAKDLGAIDRTSAGDLLGTAKYLAPEQVEGSAIDGRADIYALGAVVYEAVCGQAPFNERSDAATALARLRRDATPPRNLGVAIPDGVEHVLMQSLARDRDDRQRDIGAFRDALVDAASNPNAPVIDLRDDATLVATDFANNYDGLIARLTDRLGNRPGPSRVGGREAPGFRRPGGS